MDDVAIAGAGPAGALAATILARAGLKVRVFDRARFPRHKLCGDTLNPGALAVLRRHADVTPLIELSDPIAGMLLTGPGGVRVRGEYGGHTSGRSITRRELDRWLLDRARDAGAVIEEQVAVRGVALRDGRVGGVVAAGNGGQPLTHDARMVIAADGRRSTIAIGRALSSQPLTPRRWAIGSYFTGVAGMTTLGEMHVRRGHYIGVAPVPGGLSNVCLVLPHTPPSRTGSGDAGAKSWSQPADTLMSYLRANPELWARFEHAERIGDPVVLGPMAVDATAAGEPGLLLAGDAAGFIDPMTGDGLRFALRGAELAAAVVQDVLGGTLPIGRAHLELESRRRRDFHAKWRFNRMLRSLVSSPSHLTAASLTARLLPSVFTRMIRYAGDC
ncbi:MAG TPA: FAD-dependent monooxygenase [Vicinamibacterales bacterium]|nr:FAD-dependent monooxygenase [Vicinamibacterales bacterium]